MNIDPRNKKRAEEEIEKFRKIKPVVFSADDTHKLPKRKAVTSDLTEYAGEWGDTQVAHLLKRTLFGVKSAELNQFKAMSMSDAVDAIIAPSPAHNPPINNYAGPGTGINDPDVAYGETWAEAPYNNQFEGLRIQSLKGWVISNILNQEQTIHEKLTLFWHNLLVTQFWGIFVSKASYQYYQMLYNGAFGNYKELIKALTIDPAMLFFLNGNFNNKEAPDENYARELQELFCIGKGPDANFTESDVQAAARVLTGWVISGDNFDSEGPLTSFFYEDFHDTNDKQFSGFYDFRLIEGKEGPDGATETDELIDMLFDNEETAKYICRRLYNFFVYHEIDETTETNIIEPLATQFRTGNYEIEPILKTLFKSEHFYDAANMGAQIKSPADHFLGLWRVMEVEVSDDLYTKFLTHISMNWVMADMGMELGDPPSVAGWQAYYQTPSFDRLWINTDTVTKRAVRQDSLVYWGHWVSEGLQIPADLPAFIATLNVPEDPNLLLEELSTLLLGIPISQEVIDGMKTILLSGQTEDYYWTIAWEDYASNPTNEEFRSIVESRLKAMMSPFLQLSEHQLI